MSEKFGTPPFAVKGFYGWWIVFAGFVIFFISSGIGFYSHGVILDPLRSLHGWSKGTVSGAITLYFIANGVGGLVLGRWIDRYGPRWFLVGGSIIFAAGLTALIWADTVFGLFSAYLVMSVGFCATNLIPVNTLIVNWFVRKRGLAMSATNTGLSVGGVILVPLVSALVLGFGLNTALLSLSGIYILTIIPVTFLFVVHRPSDIGQNPDGDVRQLSLAAGSRNWTGRRQTQVWTRREAMKTAAFWAIAMAFMLALSGQIAYLVHQVSFLSQYIGPQKAAAAVSITAGASIAGRLLLGMFVDRMDNRRVIILCIFFQVLAVISLVFSSHVIILYACTFVFGLTMGPLLMMQSMIIGECFGILSFATVSGIIGLFSTAGSAFGPVVAGLIFDMTGSYRYAFVLFAAASLIAMGAICFARPPGDRPGTSMVKSEKRQP